MEYINLKHVLAECCIPKLNKSLIEKQILDN